MSIRQQTRGGRDIVPPLSSTCGERSWHWRLGPWNGRRDGRRHRKRRLISVLGRDRGSRRLPGRECPEIPAGGHRAVQPFRLLAIGHSSLWPSPGVGGTSPERKNEKARGQSTAGGNLFGVAWKRSSGDAGSCERMLRKPTANEPVIYLLKRARSERHAKPAPPITASTAVGFSGVGCWALQEFPWANANVGTARTSTASMQMRFTDSS